MNLKWYESFFRGIALDMWRSAFSPEQTRAEADFLERALRLRPGARVLDVPCGSGRHALELAGRGFRVSGVDLSEEQISAARAATAGRDLPVEWRQAEMRDLDWEAEFDGAYCFGNSFGYLEPEGTRTFLHRVSRALKTGARFALDGGVAAESALPNLRAKEWARVGDILLLEENRYHPLQSCLETHYTFVRDGDSHTRTGLQWIYTLRELCSVLAESGLEAEQCLKSLDGEPFTVGSPYLILLAAKSEGERP